MTSQAEIPAEESERHTLARIQLTRAYLRPDHGALMHEVVQHLCTAHNYFAQAMHIHALHAILLQASEMV